MVKAKIMEHLTPTASPAMTPGRTPSGMPPAMTPAMSPARTPAMTPVSSSCPTGGSLFMNDTCVCPSGTTRHNVRVPMLPGYISYCQ